MTLFLVLLLIKLIALKRKKAVVQRQPLRFRKLCRVWLWLQKKGGAERERNAFRFHLEQECWCGGKRMQTKSCRKEWNKWSQSWRGSQADFCGHTAVCYRSSSQLRAALPKCFPFAALPLAFNRSHVFQPKITFGCLKFDGQLEKLLRTACREFRVIHVSFSTV